MRGLNRVTIIGNLGRDPDVNNTRSGKHVANMSVAINEKWTKDGEKHESTEWVRCVLWDGLADVAEKYLRKGDAVYLEGKLQTRDWEDRDGGKRKTTEVVVSTLLMLGGNSRQQEKPEHPNGSTRTTNGWDDGPRNGEARDVPF